MKKLIVLLSILVSSVVAQQHIVLDTPTGSASDEFRVQMREKIREVIVANPDYSLITLQDTAAISAEWRRQMNGSVDESTAVEAGMLKGAHIILRSRLDRHNENYKLSLTLVDLYSGITINSLSKTVYGSQDQILSQDIYSAVTAILSQERVLQGESSMSEVKIRVYPRKSTLFVDNRVVETHNGIAKLQLRAPATYELRVELSGQEKSKKLAISASDLKVRSKMYVYPPRAFHVSGGVLGVVQDNRVYLAYGGEFGISLWDIHYLGISYYLGIHTNKGFDISGSDSIVSNKTVISHAMFTYLLKAELYNVLLFGIGANVGVGYSQLQETDTAGITHETRQFEIFGPVARFGLGYDWIYLILQGSYNYAYSPEQDRGTFVPRFNLMVSFTF